MKALVCGGRDFTDRTQLFNYLDTMTSITFIIEGGARGADRLAKQWAQARGVPYRTYPADWSRYRSAAGSTRNQQMLDEAQPDIVIAFQGGRGTANMVRLARSAGVRVVEV